jgi:beta-phosphoglucomutase-like phosphatase (HAD superfamily)
MFDLDGTLVDTEQLWVVAIRDYLIDRHASSTTNGLMSIVFGRSWLDIHADLLAHFPAAVPESAAVMAVELRPYYLRLRSDPKSLIITSSVETLKRLSKFAPAIIVSGSPHDDVEQAVDLIGARKEISFILGAEDYQRGKPAPDGFLEGARRLKADPAACVVFEDSPSGVRAGKAAGMRCVALDRTGLCTKYLQVADWILDDLSKFTPAAFERQLRKAQGKTE